jgi:hypothetical protein
MTRHLFFAITLIGTGVLFNGVLLNSPAEAATTQQCEDNAANCVGRCADRTGGAGDWGGHQNKCLPRCDRQLTRCMIRNAMTRRM